MALRFNSEYLLRRKNHSLLFASSGAGKTWAAMLLAGRALEARLTPVVLDAGGTWASFALAFNGKFFNVDRDAQVYTPFGDPAGTPIVFDFANGSRSAEPGPSFRDAVEIIREMPGNPYLIIDEAVYVAKCTRYLEIIVPALLEREANVLVLAQDEEENLDSLRSLMPHLRQIQPIEPPLRA